MKRALREAYDKELALLKERAAEFAAEHPGLADRLGGLLQENLDPTVSGLLEGSAFLAARVQLKMQEEFRDFTRELLDQVFPEALMPTPSVILVQATPPVDNDALYSGIRAEPGQPLDASYQDADARVSCRFSLAAPLELWPVALQDARYLDGSGQVGALGQEIAAGTKAGLVISLEKLGNGADGKVQGGFDTLSMDRLTLHFNAPLADATALYEQIHFSRSRVSLSWLDHNGDRVFRRLPPSSVTAIGFDSNERLFKRRVAQFSGFSILREYFVFPRKFLGLHIDGLAAHLASVRASEIQIVFEFSSVSAALAQRFVPEHLLLHAAPAVNLFEEVSSTVRIDQKQHELVVTPNSSPITHFEFHDIIEVWAFYAGHKHKVPVLPLYGAPLSSEGSRAALYYTIRRKPRRLTHHERRHGMSRYRYRGTETYIMLFEPAGTNPAHRLQVRGMCSNRHLPEYLPIAHGKDDIVLSNDQSVVLNCVAGPTPPRDSLADTDAAALHRSETGESLWRLVSYLSLSCFGLERDDPESTAAAVRELLSLFADSSDIHNEVQINALRKVTTRPVTRTVALADGYHAARGLEVELLFDEDGTEGNSVTLMGAVLDRFLAEYAAVNSFTQTIVKTVQRGVIAKFPPRSGRGPML
ncbi:MAG: type VI secretion system baseplate subunit TssF [Loktanella sp.]|nr:type VI secretion system baseplate subunit TssF [Loktanella sp.]